MSLLSNEEFFGMFNQVLEFLDFGFRAEHSRSAMFVSITD